VGLWLILSVSLAMKYHHRFNVKNNSIILIGMAGVGKSTVGRQLSGALKYRFIDLDLYIKEKYSRSHQNIIEDEGETAFLQKEKRCMYEIELNRTVVAPGGSIIYHFDLMEYLGGQSTLIFLDDSVANISKRMADQSGRGIVGLKDKTFRQIFEERIELYTKYADITINCRNKLPEQVTQEILDGR